MAVSVAGRWVDHLLVKGGWGTSRKIATLRLVDKL